MLIAVYAIIAIAFYYVPATPDGPEFQNHHTP